MMNKSSRLLALGVLAAGAGFCQSGLAAAQGQLLTAPEEVRSCLCLQQVVAKESAALAEQDKAYEARRREVEALDAEVTARRPQVDVNNSVAVAAFRTLLERRDAAQQSFAEQTVPAYAAVVERYNTRVNAFNQACGGKSYDSNVLAEVQRNLVCPVQ
jgi:hypothetical protein